MKKGDVIYAKQGREIVGKGIVSGSYRFDKKARLVDDRGVAWRHQVPVRWDPSFRRVRLTLGNAQRFTVRELSSRESQRLNGRQQPTKISEERQSAMEGEMERKEANFRKRNAALIQKKKEMSTYRCEACNFSFREHYGEIGEGYIIAHHATNPIGIRSRSQKTTLRDIRLLCANCHAVAHKEIPPLSVEGLRHLLERARKMRVSRSARY
jgi:predicted HNH restriction endonuclease